MKKLLFALAIAALSGAAMAQTSETPQLKYSVATNPFSSNWFITAGGSYNAFYSSQELGLSASPFNAFRRSWGAELTVGKWFTPGIGVRIKGAGLWGKQVNNVMHEVINEDGEPSREALSGERDVCPTVNQWEASIQTMFNLNNLFCGYKPRVWNISPYLGLGIGHRMVSGGTYTGLAQFGIINTFNICKRFFINLDLYWQWADRTYDGNEYQIGDVHIFDSSDNKAGVALSVGVNLGRVGWTKSPDLDAITSLNASQLAALHEELAEQQDANRILQEEYRKPLPVNEVVRTVKEVSSTPVSVFFNINSSRIASKKDLVNVQSLVDQAKANGNSIVVTGYADSKTGSAAYNQTLSEKRAQTVADALVEMGVARDKIEVRALGGVDHISPYSYNRRVVVEIK